MKIVLRLNHRCPEFRGAANSNQAHHHCPFAVPSLIPACRETVDLGWKSLAEFIFFNLKRYTIPELEEGAQPKKPFPPS